MLYKLLKLLFSFIFLFIVKIEVKNSDKIPTEGPLVVASNHLSLWDPILLGVSFPRKIHFMAKEELFKIFLLGSIIKQIGTFPVKRGTADRNAIREALKVLKNNKVLCIFPEGTRSRTGQLLDFHPGVTMIALKGCAPILPVGIKGTNNILKNGLRRVKIVVNIGEPLYIENMYKGKISSEHVDEFTKNKLHSTVEYLVQ